VTPVKDSGAGSWSCAISCTENIESLNAIYRRWLEVYQYYCIGATNNLEDAFKFVK